MSLGA
jgi:hypothetical protein